MFRKSKPVPEADLVSVPQPMDEPRRVLFYNWIPFDDDQRRGGGVTIYQRNLIYTMTAANWDVSFFSAGTAYAAQSAEPYFEKTENVFGGLCKSFRLVNSPIFAPGHDVFERPNDLFETGPAYEAFLEFLKEHGPFDVVHFNNLEGIPLSFLDVKPALPSAKVVLSHHNYYAICPQVNLWFQERETCADFDHGRKCVNCLPETYKSAAKTTLAAHQLATLLRDSGFVSGDKAFGEAFEKSDVLDLLQQLNSSRAHPILAEHAEDPDELARSYALRRKKALEMINEKVDVHIAVSERVRRVLVSMGVRADRTHVRYIGTQHAEAVLATSRRMRLLQDGRITLCYLGYMRADKGFYFLLDALEALPKSLAQKVAVHIHARSDGSPETEERLEALREHVARLYFEDGFEHNALPKILSQVDIGVVPVLWEDNLPQVAYELVSHGVPVLCSDMGGAQELAAQKAFTFAAGNIASFHTRLRDFVSGRVELAEFWQDLLPLPSLKTHVEDLAALYSDSAPSPSAPEPEIANSSPRVASKDQAMVRVLGDWPASTLYARSRFHV